jgi:neutral ceramidase
MAVHCDDKVISDDSAELQLLHQQDTEKGHGRYEVRWYPTTPSPSGACRFFVSTNQPQAVLSAPLP